MNQKKAMVTGASEGLGRAFAKRLAAEGYQITGVARNEDRLKALMQELGEDAHTYQVADLATPEGVEQISAILTQNHYHLLVNNAGIGSDGHFDETPLPRLQKMLWLNCDAVVTLSHAFLNSAKKGDTLINVSGLLGLLPVPGSGLYAATKTFIIYFSESLWYEQKDRGVYVMGLCPGPTLTNFHQRTGAKEDQLPPAEITQSPEEVVNSAMKAMKKRSRPTVFASSKGALILFTLLRMIPRKIVLKIMAQIH
jgi:short-subunit dehydrogenase